MESKGRHERIRNTVRDEGEIGVGGARVCRVMGMRHDQSM